MELLQNILIDLRDIQEFIIRKEQEKGEEDSVSVEQQPYLMENEYEAEEFATMEQQKEVEEPWKIKKQLQEHDLNFGLLIPLKMAKPHLLSVINANDDEIKEGIEVRIWDVNTRTGHTLLLTKPEKSYILTRNWIGDFVFRRNLGLGDLVGLCWDPFIKRFRFSVLSRC